ncbi:efflux RND transporter permease subunit [Aureimonas mangrovi]|uniref:efflux RND transporter permease subunit n=1 Tax=Aureimonas mangrovi TaxID=2758041 RepID=UPI00163DD293|nr:efflux RND transporter permease subunit [Aureimonas mangrovi]
MLAIIAAAFTRARTVCLTLALIMIAGTLAYVTIPKEANPEVEIPFFIVTVTYSGVSAEDSARLMVQPLERRLQSIQGLREMTAQASDGFASIILEFEPGIDNRGALLDINDEVDQAIPDLPDGADQPVVTEVDLSAFPIITVALSGAVPERDLISIGRQLRDDIEAVSGVLEVDISGERADLMEIIIDPLALQSYGLSYAQIQRAVQNNNQLIAAGAFDTGRGRIGVSVPGTIEGIADVLAIPVQTVEGTVIRVQDVAEVRQTFEDPLSFARIDGEATIGLDVRRATGANVIQTIAAVQQVVETARSGWPEAITVAYLQNQADDITTLLGDLENNVIAAVLLVMLTTLIGLGIRPSLLVALSIPGSFLGGILVIWAIGFTLNIVVLFGLILVVGLLIDGTMVVVELAERYRSDGLDRREAFLRAAQRMCWPVISATATTILVFVPLLFWPGIAGQFMLFLPATVIVTLIVSLAMALIFVPVIGSVTAGGTPTPPVEGGQRPRAYDKVLDTTIARPGLALGISVLALLLAFFFALSNNPGVEFFPSTEPERAQIQIGAEGNLSVAEADRLVSLVENAVIGTAGVERVYARTIGSVDDRLRQSLPPDTVGTLQVDFLDWRQREPASEIVAELRERANAVPGVSVQIEEQSGGPGSGRPVDIQISAEDRAALPGAVAQLRQLMTEQGSFVDVASDVPQPQPEARIIVDREQAARYGVDMASVGAAVQLLTNGVVLGNFLPSFADEEVDIVLRYPVDERNFAQLANLRIQADGGLIPMTNFVRLEAGPATAVINRVDSQNVQSVTANVAPGTTVAAELATLGATIDETDFGDGVAVTFGGELADQEEAGTFLVIAFLLAVFLMFLVFVTQFDSFYQSLVVVSAILFSIGGVLVSLTLRGDPFAIVMTGIAMIAAAGIVINNNIVLIDAFNEHRASGLSPNEAARLAGTERFRPVLLTAATTVTGLLPMVLGLTVDFINRDAFFGAPSGQYWIQLSTGIVGGLVFSTVITMLLTPTLLAWDGRRRESKGKREAGERPSLKLEYGLMQGCLSRARNR